MVSAYVQFPNDGCRSYLVADLFLILSREVDEVIVFGANKEWDSGLVEASPLSIPLLDAVQR
jgi:hypothetical protein